MPTFAFVNGAVMGGGLELALHCHYRTLAANAAAIALPEVFLGLVPGWGGTQLLPNLIGAEQRRHRDHRERAEPEQDAQARSRPSSLGIADVLFESADFLEQSLLWAASVVRGDVVPCSAPRSTAGGAGTPPSRGPRPSSTAGPRARRRVR